MADRLKSTIAIITGASRGIGEATARAFAAQGARVVIASRKQQPLDEVAAAINADHPNAVLARACHIGEPDQIEQLIEFCVDELGVPNVLVNNAATNPYFGPVIDTPMSAWDKTFDVNLKGYFLLSQAVVKRLQSEQMPGAIVNVASIAGMRAMPFQGVYGMTKAAVIAMTRSMALELGHSNIRVNAIAPGLVDTRLAAAITSSDEASRFFTDRAPLHRIGQPEEIADLIVYLASDESSFISGHCMPIDAGFTIT